MNSKPYSFEGFTGDFKELLIQFVQMKQSLGYKYRTEADTLKRFSQFTTKFTIINHALTKEIVESWTEKRPTELDVTWGKRINNLKQFALFLNNQGYEAYVPVCKARINRYQYVPYIFTTVQLDLFFTECDSIKPHPLSHKCLLLPAIYRMLYGCGLRISEAVALKRKDVDLNQGVIKIYGSKFNKDRLIPMSSSLTSYMQSYSLKIHAVSHSEDYFFMKKDKTAISSDTVYKNFRKILWKCGISHGGKGKGPRLHDFRHTFAVHSLNQMVRQKIELYCALPILSTYLGHTSQEVTERYVRLTKEVYPEILTMVSKTCSYIFPEVNAQ